MTAAMAGKMALTGLVCVVIGFDSCIVKDLKDSLLGEFFLWHNQQGLVFVFDVYVAVFRL
jgi:hypothetical protein